MQMDLLDLAPDTFYHLQMRSLSGSKVGPWGPIFQFVTELDNEPPPVVTNLEVVPKGTAFVVTWDKPTGPTMVDFKNYEVQVQVAGATQNYNVTQARFEFTQEMNLGFFGTLQGAITFRVRTVDQVGNWSEWVEAEGTNAPPQEVPNVEATAVGNGIEVNWGLVSDEDIKHYSVYVKTGTAPAPTDLGTAVWSGSATSFTYSTLSYGLDHHISVRAVDIFDTPSETAVWQGPLRPINFNEVDVTPPPNPTAVTATGTVNSVTLTWATPAGSDVVGYRIRFKKDSETDDKYNYLSLAGAATSIVIPNLDATILYDVGIQGHDASFNSSAWIDKTATPTVDTTVLAAPATLGGYAKPDQISLIWSDVVGAVDYEVQISLASTFTSPTTQFPTFPFAVFLGLTPKTTYHVRARARNRSKTPGQWKTTTVATPEFDTVRFGDQSISGGVIIEDTLAGNRVMANSLDADTLKANTAFTQQLTVANRFTMGTGTSGEIVSGNFYPSGGASGYRLTQDSLDIRSGAINAGIITSGELRSQSFVSTDGTSQPRWSLNTQGNMQINDGVVRGSLVIGSYSSTNTYAVSVQNHSYSPGNSGWVIRASGAAEFNQVTIRGTVYATGGNFSGSLSVNNSFFVDSSGNMGIGGTYAQNGPFRVTSGGYLVASSGQIAGWNINGSTIYSGASNYYVAMSTGSTAFQAGGGRFSVTQYGYLSATDAYITGNINASSGSIGGWSIDSLGIYGSGRISGGTIQGTTLYNRTYGQRWELLGSDYSTGQYLRFYPGFGNDSPGYSGMITQGSSTAQMILQSPDFGWGRATVRAFTSTGGSRQISLEASTISIQGTVNGDGDYLLTGAFKGQNPSGGNFSSWQTANDGGMVLTSNGAGVFSATGIGGSGRKMFASAFDIYSSGEDKESVVSLRTSDKVVEGSSIEKIKRIKPVSFKRKSEREGKTKDAGRVYLGVIAEEVQQVLPQATYVHEFPANDETGEPAKTQHFVDIMALVTMLIGSVQDLDEKITDLEKQIAKKK